MSTEVLIDIKQVGGKLLRKCRNKLGAVSRKLQEKKEKYRNRLSNSATQHSAPPVPELRQADALQEADEGKEADSSTVLSQASE